MGVARWPRGEAGGVQPVAGRFESFPRLLKGEEHEQSCALLGQESWSTARTAAAAPHRPKDPARERRYRRDRERPVLGWLWEDLELLVLARSSTRRAPAGCLRCRDGAPGSIGSSSRITAAPKER